ncbi:hypothetical protein F-VV10_0106 [Faustovirus]|nr:hypothetical protein F-VV10_0106 [Faustovirus]
MSSVNSNPNLNTDVLNIIIDMCPVAFLNVDKRCNVRAFNCLVSGSIPGNLLQREHFERFMSCSKVAQFGALLPRFTPVVMSTCNAAIYLYSHNLHAKLEILADYHSKLSTECLMPIKKSQLVEYFARYDIDGIALNTNTSTIRLSKWACNINPKHLLGALTSAQIIDLYETRSDITRIESLTTDKVLLELSTDRLTTVLRCAKTCSVNVLIKVIKTGMVDVLEMIAAGKVKLNSDHTLGRIFERAYIAACINTHDVHMATIGTVIHRLCEINTEPGFVKTMALFNHYVDAYKMRDEMPEIVNYRMENLLSDIKPENDAKMFELLFEWCCKMKDTELALKLANCGAMREISIKEHPYKDQGLYTKMIIEMLPIVDRYPHMLTASIIITQLEEIGITSDLKVAIESFIKATKSCNCSANEILKRALTLIQSQAQLHKLGELKKKLVNPLQELFNIAVLQAIIMSDQ